MSFNLPFRPSRIPHIQRQCLFQRQRHATTPRVFSTTTPQLFASTSPRLRRSRKLDRDWSMTKHALRTRSGPAPEVDLVKAGSITEDIGLLQGTIIRASTSQLPAPWSLRFWGYFWKLFKSKVSGLYSRSMLKRRLYKKGWRSFVPIDFLNGIQLRERARSIYEVIYTHFAKGDMRLADPVLLPPLARSFQSRLAARDSLTMEWAMKDCKARIVSHRVVMLDEDEPGTSFRQVIVRLESTQVLKITDLDPKQWRAPQATKMPRPRGLMWIPTQARTARKGKRVKRPDTRSLEFVDNGVPKRVVEYMVLQKRKIGIEEEDWKAWGFAQETTPEMIEEDEKYWGRMMASSTG